MDGPSSPPCLHRCAVKEDLPPAITKARGRLHHYLEGGGYGYGGASGSRFVVFEAECMARQQARYNRRNVGRRSMFAKSDVAPECVRSDPDLVVA